MSSYYFSLPHWKIQTFLFSLKLNKWGFEIRNFTCFTGPSVAQKYQLLTQKCQFLTQKCQFLTEKWHFLTQNVNFWFKNVNFWLKHINYWLKNINFLLKNVNFWLKHVKKEFHTAIRPQHQANILPGKSIYLVFGIEIN